MCYSKEVQLITSLIIIFSALFYYFYYSNKYKTEKKWLLSFLNSSTLVFLMIGLHQFFEFLTLITNNLWVYKIGLILSICGVYFLIRTLEVLSNKNLHHWIALLVILGVSIQIMIVPMEFGAANFYLQHNSAFFWAAAWLFLFFYWNIWALKIYFGLGDDNSKKTLLIYLLTIADVSFILSAIYVLAGYFLFSVNVCTDAPSIWCTFYVIQSFLIPILLFRLPLAFERKNKTAVASFKETITYLLISLIILTALALTLPLFDCLTWKLVFS